MLIMKTRMTLLAVVALACMVFSACGEKETYNDFEDQQIPSELCGTWYEQSAGTSFFDYITIHSDGTIDARFFDGSHSVIEKKGRCYYKDGIIRFYKKENYGNYEWVDDSKMQVAEWTKNTLILGHEYASFFTRTPDDTVTYSYIDTVRLPQLVGTWNAISPSYNHYDFYSSNDWIKLNADGSGSYARSSYSTSSTIVDWFVRDKWLFVKTSGSSYIRFYRYEQSGRGYYLYGSITRSKDPYYLKQI